MLSICKKELGQFFSSLTGIIAIIVFLLANGLVLFVFRNNILEEGFATLDRFFALAPWILLFLIPAITMRSFADEYRGGTFEVLRTRPLTPGQLVTGKFLGSLLIVLIALLPTFVYYITINRLAATSGIDAGAAAGSYLGLLFLAAVFTAISICISSYTHNAVVAFILSVIALALLYYGFQAISQLTGMSGRTAWYIEMLGIDAHYRSISRGVLDTRDLFYFISLILFFLYLTVLQVEGVTPSKRRLRIVLAVILLVVVNMLAGAFHARTDLTEEKRYSLSYPTKSLLQGLDSTVTIDVFLEGDEMPAVVRKFRSDLDEFLQEAKEQGRGQLQYRFINPYAGEDTAAVRSFVDSLNNYYGLYPMTLNAPEGVGDKMEITNIIHGAVVHYRDRSAGIDLLKGVPAYGTEPEQLAALYNNLEASLEYKFASGIQKLTVKEKPLVAYALGNGEAWGPNIDDAFRTLRNDYLADTLNIRKVPYIPSQVNALVILKPTIPFTDEDKMKIDQYVMRGGKVFWMIDNMYAEFDSLYQSGGFIAYDRSLNLEDLLFTYGVRIDQALVQDMQSDQLPQVSTQGGQQRLVSWPFFPILDGTKHPISKNLDGVRSLFPTKLDTVGAPGIRKTILLQTSANARLLPAPAKIDFEFLQIAPDEASFRAKNIPVGILLEGPFRSLYRGRAPRSVRDSLEQYGVPFRDAADAPGKMIVVSDGDIAQNGFSPSMGPLPMGMNVFTRYTYANKDFFSNSLEYLVNPTDILQTRSKEYTLRLLDPRRVSAQRTTWQLVNIALPVLLIILFGVGYQQFRKRRYAG